MIFDDDKVYSVQDAVTILKTRSASSVRQRMAGSDMAPEEALSPNQKRNVLRGAKHWRGVTFNKVFSESPQAVKTIATVRIDGELADKFRQRAKAQDLTLPKYTKNLTSFECPGCGDMAYSEMVGVEITCSSCGKEYTTQ